MGLGYVALSLLVVAGVPDLSTASTCEWDEVTAISYSTLKACLDAVPYSEAWRNGTVDTLSTALDVGLPFLDTLKNTGPPWGEKVDLLDGLAAIRATTYSSDSAFQDDVTTLMASMHDAHTVYIKPGCYSNLYFRQPFSLDVRMVGSRQAVFFGAAFPFIENFNASLEGLEVAAVGGLEVLSAISDWADAAQYKSKDQGARFNAAVSPALPGFVVRYLRYSTVPAEELVTWTLRDEAGGEFDVDLAWTGLAMPGASTDPAGCDAETAAATAESQTTMAAAKKEKTARKEVLRQQLKLQTPLTEGVTAPPPLPTLPTPPAPRAASAAAWYNITLLTDSSEGVLMAALLSPDNATGVLRVASFSPPFSSDAIWATALYDALALFAEAGAKQLLLDVVGNGGGSVCLGLETAAFLVKDEFDYLHANGRARSGLYDWRASPSLAPYFEKMGNADLGYLDPVTGEPFPDGAYYTDGPSKRRGGAVSAYSEPFSLDCDDLVDPTLDDDAESLDDDRVPANYSLPTDLPVWFHPQQLLVLTDGLCGSTCATFVARLQENNWARVAGVGGLKYQDLQSQSFAGGFTTNVDVLNELLEEGGQPTIPAFPTTALWQLAWAELYSEVETEQPLQFTNLPTDFNLDYWDYNAANSASQIALYELAIESL